MKTRHIAKYLLSATALSLSAALPVSAWAQAAQDAESDEAKEKDEIVVTGTLIRGVAPVGAQQITLGQEKLDETGAISSNELLASVPQVSNYFNRIPIADLGIAVNQIQISRPNLRNLVSPNASSASTLIIVDGHRVASAGVNQASVDPDLIPIGAIQRVDVVTEGGSATYGADAVAGVINFVTLRRFDGVKVSGNYGFAKNYWQYNADATVGKEWDNGSAYVSYTYSKSDALYGRERNYIRNLDYSATPYRGMDLGCANPNLALNTSIGTTVIASRTFAAPAFAANTSNRCDNTDDRAVVPQAERHGVFGGLSWDFGDSTSIDARAYWSRRETRARSDFTGSVTVSAANPYVGSSLPAGLVVGPIGPCIPGLPFPCTNTAAVQFNLSPFLGRSAARSDTRIQQYGANLELKQEFGDNWELRVLGNYGHTNSFYELTRLNQTRLNAAGSATTTATAFNPLVLTNNNAALVADLIDNAITGQTTDSLLNFRAIVDGSLFELPAGPVKIAVGYEYAHDKLKRRFASDIRLGALGNIAYTPYTRNVNSLFGEINAPILSKGDGDPLLTLLASGRYDKYSDFGSTFNPKFGLTLKPSNWLTLRGNYGTSFTAPTPVDQLGGLASFISGFPFVPFVPAAGPQPLAGSNTTIAIQGSVAPLAPQEADTFALGADFTPFVIPGSRVSVTYYSVDFTNILRSPTPNAGIFTDYPNNVLYNINGLSAAQVNTFFTRNGPLSASLATQLASAIAGAGGGRITELVDFRVGNFGVTKVKGLDLNVFYKTDVSFGSIDFNWNMNVQLSRKSQVSPTSGVVDELKRENSHRTFQMALGTDIGNLRAQASLNHSGGYNILQTTSAPVQDRVKAYNTVNLFFKYDVPSESKLLKDLSFTLNVNNVFDKDPPILRRNNPNELGFANGFTLGRLVNVGISKKF